MYYYTLDANGEPVIEPDQNKWARWINTANIHVARDTVHGGIISTVFLGHAFEPENPTLWETAVVGGRLDQVKDRCAGNRDQALTMHAKMLERAQGGGMTT